MTPSSGTFNIDAVSSIHIILSEKYSLAKLIMFTSIHALFCLFMFAINHDLSFVFKFTIRYTTASPANMAVYKIAKKFKRLYLN